ncbi:hypothetical protein [Hyalangium rubrum]|uniref:Bacteriocin n=1 Tax=Hyalangium rubrum TaxID=3103134 RepID=A0ABU5H5J9_9BACT|nr:hypothetical protein [Hyalangium sp. s54d21]MDY7228738.1 hypothetical protein [Hyalangium sp. s54d21]
MEKKTGKKLSLKSETIRSLTSSQGGHELKRGTTAITCTCPRTQECIANPDDTDYLG